MDTMRLKKEARIEDVCSYLGVGVTRRGGVNFILCPLPEHGDTHATNCFFKRGDNFLYCTVCNRKINAIDLIMEKEHTDFKSAMEILYEIEGRPEWFKPENKGQVKVPIISGSEAALIGLNLEGWKEYLSKREFLSIILAKCDTSLERCSIVERSLGMDSLFEDKIKKIKKIKERIIENMGVSV